MAARAWLRTQLKKSDAKIARFGEGHASWWVLAETAPGAVAYCGGVGLDATYDFALADKMALEVHSFDPTPTSVEYMQRSNAGRVCFHPWGFLDRDDKVRFHAPTDPRHANWFVENLHRTDAFFEADCFTIETAMEKLGHSKIELLKIDIEGSWARVLTDMLEKGIFPNQLCVEFDSPAPIWSVMKIVKRLHAEEYQLVRRSKENCFFIRRMPRY
ncbi:FkbM family methyltransferase [Aurantiacibacter aquimixticola]|uniref:FkbM family methyltransferase n=1 Tax=Aurantiacibacter aquimixticola TaxID=1958945 RepID=A0A419RUI6_9SPHN|nr:FkbM family methyltransferase [Aurantiacibacter aquimixticola]RJY09457.1 FkbM family methyltransferase [Aurantiacibacter aquimixticola]